MKTDNLIYALAEDAPATPGAGRRRALALLAASAIVPALFVAFALDVRDDLSDAGSWPTLRKLVFTLLFLATAARGATLLMSPDAKLRNALVWIAAPLAAIIAFIGAEIAINGAADLGERAMGSSALQCLAAVFVLALAPLGAFIYGLRDGAAARPDIAGALAGIAAGGLAASFYALYCTDDSPLFVGVWYGLAIALVGAGGWLAGRRLLRW